jgi:hypothetical protein
LLFKKYFNREDFWGYAAQAGKVLLRQ